MIPFLRSIGIVATFPTFLVEIRGEAPPLEALEEYKQAHVGVELPYHTILLDELLHVRLTVENFGEEPLAIVEDGQNDGLQLMWIPWKDSGPDSRPGRIPGVGNYRESPLELVSEGNLDIHGWKELEKGEKYHVERLHAPSIKAAYPPNLGSFRLMPAMYVGDNRVVYGTPVGLTVIDRVTTDFLLVFEDTFTTGRSTLPIRIYRVSIEGETYLYNNTGVRFCRIPPDTGFAVDFKQEGLERVTTVTFDDPALNPHVFSWRKYQLVSASRETVPWLFDKPEKNESATSAVEGNPAPTAATETVSSSRVEPTATIGASWWPWVAAAVVALLALGWIARKNAA
jgi:hypothetical protein